MTAVSTARTAASTDPGTSPTAGATTAGWSLGFAVSSALMASGLIVILVMVRPAPMTPNFRRTSAAPSRDRPGPSD